MKKFKRLLAIFCIAFLLNFIWENAQAPLYQGYISFWQHFWICLRASLWDAGYITIVYCAIMVIHRAIGVKQKTPDQEKSVSKVLTTISIIVLGFVTAAYIELHALTQGRWAYSAAMPLVPIIHVGFAPFLQLALLSLLTYRIILKYTKR